jgi:ATP-dependent helicase/nuclease subunit B
MKYGQNKLSFEVSLQFIHQFIDKQIREIKTTASPIRIVELEKKDFEVTYHWEINGTAKKIKLSGKADRIDEIGDLTRIIDYKSGKCDSKKVSLSANHLKDDGMQKLLQQGDKSYARQLLMYALMFRAAYPDRKNFTAGIISMININDWLQNVCVDKNGDQSLNDQLLNTFEAALKNQVEALYGNDFLFAHNPGSQYCEHCEK